MEAVFDMPLVSVVMSVYNGEAFIRASIESILRQSFSDFELIIINDGSSDGSVRIIRKFAEIDSRVQLIDRENRGLIASLNEGCDRAVGRYIARMDADDVAMQERFAKQIAFMEAHPEVVACGTRVTLVNENDMPIKSMGTYSAHRDIDDQHMLGLGGAIIHPSAMIRTESIRSIGGYSADYPHAEDLDLWLRLAEVGRLANLDEVLLYYRQHPYSIGSQKRWVQYEFAKLAVQNAHTRRGMVFDPEKFAPVPEVVDVAGLYLKWGWWALGAGNVQTARFYARKYMAARPFNHKAWRLLITSLRGY